MSKYETKSVDALVKRLKRQHAIEMLIFGVPFALGVLAGLFGFIPNEWLGWAIALLSAIWLPMFIRQQKRDRWRRINRSECPNCASELLHSKCVPNTQVTATCNQCRIIWDLDRKYVSE